MADDRLGLLRAEIVAEIEAQLRELQGDVGIQLFLRDTVEHAKIHLPSADRVLPGSHVLPEVIEANRHARLVAYPRGGQGVVQFFPGNKPARGPARQGIGKNETLKGLGCGESDQEGSHHAWEPLPEPARSKWRGWRASICGELLP